MRKPNLYKGMVGIMDYTYKELTDRLTTRDLYVDSAELCRAVRGFKGQKYDRIRLSLEKIFYSWVLEMVKEGDAGPVEQFAKNISTVSKVRTEVRK